MTQRSLFLAVVVVTTGLAVGAAVAPAADPDPVTRAGMVSLYRAVETGFLNALDPEGFEAEANRESILAALVRISEGGTALRNHARLGETGFGYIGGTMANHARLALDRFEVGETEAARILVLRLNDYCFACHSRLPDDGGSGMGRRLLEDPRVQALAPGNRMLLAVSARQFGQALDMGEEALSAPDLSPREADATGVLDRYLRIATRVWNEPARPLEVLRLLRERDDVPAYLAGYLDAWIGTMESLKASGGGDDLLRARELIRGGNAANRYSADRRGMIHFMVASGLLHRFVENTADDPAAASEAHYLLGLTEMHGSRSSLPSEVEFYLETAIRLDPAAPHSRDAYAILEELVTAAYTGSAGVVVPEAVQRDLDELRSLVEGS